MTLTDEVIFPSFDKPPLINIPHKQEYYSREHIFDCFSQQASRIDLTCANRKTTQALVYYFIALLAFSLPFCFLLPSVVLLLELLTLFSQPKGTLQALQDNVFVTGEKDDCCSHSRRRSRGYVNNVNVVVDVIIILIECTRRPHCIV